MNSVYSIIQNILKSLSVLNGSMVNIDRDKSMKFALLIGSLNYASRNSNYSVKFLYSCNFKDISSKLLLYEDCKLKLSKWIDINSYSKYLNWNFMNTTYWPECMKNNRGIATHPFKLILSIINYWFQLSILFN